MDLLQILVCDPDLITIVGIVRWALRLICIAIPIILIVLVVIDLSKVVTAGNIDDKMKKEVSQKVVTRVVYSVLIFLVPTIVGLFFKFVPLGNVPGYDNSTWKDCWEGR